MICFVDCAALCCVVALQCPLPILLLMTTNICSSFHEMMGFQRAGRQQLSAWTAHRLCCVLCPFCGSWSFEDLMSNMCLCFVHRTRHTNVVDMLDLV